MAKIFWEVLKGGKTEAVVVKICSEQLERVKEKHRSTAAQEGGAEAISKNDVAVAYAWILMRKLQRRLGLLRNTDRENKSRMLLAADLRVPGRLGADDWLGAEYFGNAALAVDVSGPEEMSLVECASAVRSAVLGLKRTTKTSR